MKVKLTKLFHPNISKLTTENGGRGTHFAKFLISLFQWGLTHSALDVRDAWREVQEFAFIADNARIRSIDC